MCGSFAVVGNGLWLAMLRSIQLNGDFCFMAKEIDNIVGDDLLPPESWMAVTKEIIPQVPLFLCHILSKGSGVVKQRMILSVAHGAFLSDSWCKSGYETEIPLGEVSEAD